MKKTINLPLTNTISKMAERKKTPNAIAGRLAKIRFILEDSKTDAIMISDINNIRYLTGFSGSAANLLIFPDKIHLVTDDRYEEQLEWDLYDMPEIETHITRDYWQYLKDNGLLKNVKSILFEADKMPYGVAVETRNIIRPIKFKPTESTMDIFMVPKDPLELEAIKEACRIAEASYEKIIKKIKTGISEQELSAELAYICRMEGSEGPPFPFIVLSGKNTSLPHGKPNPEKKIKKNELVLFDFGCKVDGFGSDITRTVCYGKPTKEMTTAYSALVEAQNAAIKETHAFMKSDILDQKAREVLKKHKLEEYFKHSLGHGIGYSAHEHPIISIRKPEENIPQNSVLAIEPGVYMPGKWGMRIEDNIFVTVKDVERLTNAPAKLPTIS
ncbi:MAG: Xaa-Pro peptidase family protein [Candidatus Kapaibacteriales bacterium]